MFTIRPYRPEDAMGCGECFYEGFFSCPIDANDRAFLRDYGQVLVEKCNFTYQPLPGVDSIALSHPVSSSCCQTPIRLQHDTTRQYELASHHP